MKNGVAEGVGSNPHETSPQGISRFSFSKIFRKIQMNFVWENWLFNLDLGTFGQVVVNQR